VQLKEEVHASASLADELVEHCRSALAHYKCPRSIDFTDALPRSDTGKLYRRIVREPYWHGRAAKI
jgi:long-chain acyl-CoA synthetase